jgi:hypothetical protein
MRLHEFNNTGDATMPEPQSYDEVVAYLKKFYPISKKYRVKSFDTGWITPNGDSIIPPRYGTDLSDLDAVAKKLDLTFFTNLSGAHHVTTVIRVYWYTFRNKDIALVWYTQVPSYDEIVVFSSNAENFAKIKSVLIDAGLLPNPAEAKKKREVTKQKRMALLTKKGIEPGKEFYYWSNKVKVLGITPSGKVKVQFIDDQKEETVAGGSLSTVPRTYF